MAQPVIHWELGTRDARALSAFYTDLFGWEVTPAGPEYSLVAGVGDGIGGGIMQVGDQMPPYLTIYVAVPKLEEALARSTELGATTLVPPTPIEGVGRFALFQDPDDHIVGMLEGIDSGAADPGGEHG